MVAGADTNNTAGTYGTHGDSRCGELSGVAKLFNQLDRFRQGTSGCSVVRATMAPELWQHERPVEVERGRMDLGGRLQCCRQRRASMGPRERVRASNVPDNDRDAEGWTDGSGNLWLFGGNGSVFGWSFPYSHNDLWKYKVASGFGSPVQIDPTCGNVWNGRNGRCFKCSRIEASTPMTWTDKSGNLWLFGETASIRWERRLCRPQRFVEVQSQQRPMDLDRRIRCRRQCLEPMEPWELPPPLTCRVREASVQLDRQVRQLLALRRSRLRFSGNHRLSE